MALSGRLFSSKKVARHRYASAGTGPSESRDALTVVDAGSSPLMARSAGLHSQLTELCTRYHIQGLLVVTYTCLTVRIHRAIISIFTVLPPLEVFVSLHLKMVPTALQLGLDAFNSESVSVQVLVQCLMHTLVGPTYLGLLWRKCQQVRILAARAHVDPS